MKRSTSKHRIALIGGGPSALFVFKHLLELGANDLTIDIFEARSTLGGGMPYSRAGANNEHITNVSCNEIPTLVTSVVEWVRELSDDETRGFDIRRDTFNEHHVLPRLLFGRYLEHQFDLLLIRARDAGIKVAVHLNCRVDDIVDEPSTSTTRIETSDGATQTFDSVVVCTGHFWPRRNEGAVPNYFDSPYPPSKLVQRSNHAVALRGSSLTAVDAIRTLARGNGNFERNAQGKLEFHAHEEAADFRMVMHTRHGLLPCIRFHTETPQVGRDALISPEDIAINRARNDGFLTLDFIFDKKFREPLRENDPEFYERIKGLSIEEFVEQMLSLRESVDAFAFFKGEYAEAAKSIKRQQSIYWKEMLSALSFAMNYPAKHLSAEDMFRHQQVLMPLIAVVIAFVPQSSAEELIALHDAGRLSLVAVGAESRVVPNEAGGATVTLGDESDEEAALSYRTFVDCIGQMHLSLDDFPFRSLVEDGDVVQATLPFRSNDKAEAIESDNVFREAGGNYYLKLPGMAINDAFQIIDRNDVPSARIFMMAVPFIGGYNPDYSGLDFADEAGSVVAKTIAGGWDASAD